jgi:Domain of unknown function (DUF4178)
MDGPALTPGAAGSVRGFNCPSCGAAIALRGMAWTQSVACGQCGAVLDANDPNLRVLARFDQRVKVRPLIPLGAKGEWRGATRQVIGFQQRTITVDGVKYSWREYLLFNPYHGFRYLTEYDGHWNDVVPLPGAPVVASAMRPVATYDGHDYKHFQQATAETTFVLGEFPWEVRAGDTVVADDYVAPPFILSRERSEDEATWSRGEYVDGRAIWKAFGLPGAPPSPRGVYANQPSPHAGDAASYWKLFGAFAAVLVALMVMRLATARDASVFRERYLYDPMDTAQAFVTPVFELPGGSGNVAIRTETDVSNQWLYVEYALINERTGQAWDFSREVSYYSGYDGDGRWSEGSRNDQAKIGPVPGGRYFLRIEPQGGASEVARPSDRTPISYAVVVRRDVPSLAFWLVGLLLLVTPPVFGSLRAASFETQRWAESGYAPSGGDDDE